MTDGLQHSYPITWSADQTLNHQQELFGFERNQVFFHVQEICCLVVAVPRQISNHNNANIDNKTKYLMFFCFGLTKFTLNDVVSNQKNKRS